MDLHLKQWNELWEGDIQIVGDAEAQLAVRFAKYPKGGAAFWRRCFL